MPELIQEKDRRKLEKLSHNERIKIAKEKLELLKENIIELIYLRKNCFYFQENEILRKQIPKSHAAHAFNKITFSLYDYELIFICSLWDSFGKDRISIPTIFCYIDDEEILFSLCDKKTSIRIEPYNSTLQQKLKI